MTEYKILTVKIERLEEWSDDGMAAGYLWEAKDIQSIFGGWLHGCCKCGVVGGLDHTITVDEHGRPTIHPSIRCGAPGCDAHYWVKDGKVTPS